MVEVYLGEIKSLKEVVGGVMRVNYVESIYVGHYTEKVGND